MHRLTEVTAVKRPRGRPRKYANVVRLETYLEQAEYDFVARHCHSTGQAITEFVRRCILRALLEIAEERRPK